MFGSKLLQRKALVLACLAPTAVFAQQAVTVGADPVDPSFAAPVGESGNNNVFITQHGLENGEFDFETIRQQGIQLFSTPFNTYDGFGDGPVNHENLIEAGGRPSYVEGNPDLRFPGLRRINGGDAQTCLECHFIGSNAVIPARLQVAGIAGIGGTAFPNVTNIDADLNESLGDVAVITGRAINPPFLFGVGGIELAGREMTQKLHAIRDEAQNFPGEWFELDALGVNFGKIRWVISEDQVEDAEELEEQENLRFFHNCNPPGTSLASDAELYSSTRFGQGAPLMPTQMGEMEDGTVLTLDVSQIEGIGQDLIVRPLGRKGGAMTTRDFDCDAARFHFGIEAQEIFGFGVDHDGDGYANEIEPGQLSALEIANTTNFKPVIEIPRNRKERRSARRGFQTFKDIGCAYCHIPALETEGSVLTYHFPESAPGLRLFPEETKFYEVDLVEVAGFRRNRNGGIVLPSFSDLKVHYMGERLRETDQNSGPQTDENGNVLLDPNGNPRDPNFTFITARLWGIADTAPYMHDGRAPTLTEAILQHDGEAYEVRENFRALSDDEKLDVLTFLRTLKTPTHNPF